MGSSLRDIDDIRRVPDDAPSDGESARLSEFEPEPRLGDRLRGVLDDVNVDSVRAVRELRERE